MSDRFPEFLEFMQSAVLEGVPWAINFSGHWEDSTTAQKVWLYEKFEGWRQTVSDSNLPPAEPNVEESQIQPQQDFPRIYSPPDPGLTLPEKQCIAHLANAFNSFVGLEGKLPTDNAEFAKSIDECHRLIAMRVARRVNPEIWRQPEEKKDEPVPEVQPDNKSENA